MRQKTRLRSASNDPTQSKGVRDRSKAWNGNITHPESEGSFGHHGPLPKLDHGACVNPTRPRPACRSVGRIQISDFQEHARKSLANSSRYIQMSPCRVLLAANGQPRPRTLEARPCTKSSRRRGRIQTTRNMTGRRKQDTLTGLMMKSTRMLSVGGSRSCRRRSGGSEIFGWSSLHLRH